MGGEKKVRGWRGGNGREFFDGVVMWLLIYFKVETKVR